MWDILKGDLKGLSHEIDFKKFDKNLQNLTQLVFEFFRGSDDFINQKVHLLRLMPVYVGLIVVRCLLLSVPPNYKWSITEQG